ncbi:hypothetical protein ACT41Q_13510 [Acinetobacter baumannii]
MLKKSLHDQIKIIGFWTFCGVFWYLVLAFFLKSKYPIFDYSFNLEIAYDVIKDALTLAAAFLAPIAAFVLFNDWRETHARITNEKTSIEIMDTLREMNSLTTRGYSELAADNEVKKKDSEKLTNLNRLLSSLISRINSVDKDAEDFKANVYEMRIVINEWWHFLNIAVYLYFDHSNNKRDEESNSHLFSEINKWGANATKKAILFSEKFHSIKPLLV